VLTQRDDIRTGFGEERADGGDQARTVYATQQQTTDIPGR
jgi:hypothetical protein